MFIYFFVAFVTFCDRHIIIGTPNQVVALNLLGVFNSTNLNMIVFDDADITTTSKFVNQLVQGKCQKVYVTSTYFNAKNATNMKLVADNKILPQGISHYYVKCADFSEKLNIINVICELVESMPDTKMIIFCTVSNSLNSTYS